MLVLRMMIIGEWWCFPSTGVSATDSVMKSLASSAVVLCAVYMFGVLSIVMVLAHLCELFPSPVWSHHGVPFGMMCIEIP